MKEFQRFSGLKEDPGPWTVGRMESSGVPAEHAQLSTPKAPEVPGEMVFFTMKHPQKCIAEKQDHHYMGYYSRKIGESCYIIPYNGADIPWCI